MLLRKQCLSAANWYRNMKLNISLKSKSLSMQNAESYMWNTSTTHISRFQYQREFFTFLIKKHAFVIIFQAQLILLSSSSLCLCAFFSLNSSVLGGRQKENLLCRYSNIHKKIINFLFCSIGRKLKFSSFLCFLVVSLALWCGSMFVLVEGGGRRWW